MAPPLEQRSAADPGPQPDNPIDYLVHVRRVALPLYPQFDLESNVYDIPPERVSPPFLRKMFDPGVDEAIKTYRKAANDSDLAGLLGLFGATGDDTVAARRRTSRCRGAQDPQRLGAAGDAGGDMNAGNLAPADRVRHLLREAAMWRLLARLFECPDDRWRADIAALARELDDPEIWAGVNAVDAAATDGQYHSVFGPGGPASPREATYHETLELGSLMSELAVYYQAFAYSPRLVETPDHVAVEAGFVSFLKLKEAYACAEGDEEHAELAARTAARFVADHLATIASPLADRLAVSSVDYLMHASRLLAKQVGPRPQSTRLPVLQNASDDDEGSEFTCAAP